MLANGGDGVLVRMTYHCYTDKSKADEDRADEYVLVAFVEGVCPKYKHHYWRLTRIPCSVPGLAARTADDNLSSNNVILVEGLQMATSGLK
jgi:hypothetical protein